MASYIKSEDIVVFPAGFRDTAYAISKRTTEENLLKLAKLSSNKDNLNQLFYDPDDNNFVIINIQGYCFRCLEDDVPVENDLKAYIKVWLDETLGYILSPDAGTVKGQLLDQLPDGGSAGEEDFKGLSFTTGNIPPNVNTNEDNIKYYGFQIRDASGNLLIQNLKLDTAEIRNITGTNTTKAISEEFKTGILTATTINSSTINGLTVDTTTGTLDIANGKTLKVDTDITIASGGDNLTIDGGSGTTEILPGTMVEKDAEQTLTNKSINGITLSGDTARTLTIYGADKTISGVGTNITLNKNLTVADADKTIAGTGENLTIRNDLNIGGTTAQITLGTDSQTLRFTTNGDTNVTLPTNGTLSTLAGTETLTNKTIKTLIVKDSDDSNYYTFGVADLTSNKTVSLPALSGESDTFVFVNQEQTLANKTLTAPDINGGTADMLTGLSVRDKSAAYDLEIKSNSSNNLTSNKSLTFDVSNNNRTIKLTGSPTLSGITTTGTGTLALGDKNLTVADANKTLAGAGTNLTIRNNLNIGGITGQITIGSDAASVLIPDPTAYAVAYGKDSVAYGFSAVPTATGQALLGNTAGRPTWTTGTLTLGSNLVTNGGTITLGSDGSGARTLQLYGLTPTASTTYNIKPFANKSVLYASEANTISGIAANGTATTKVLTQTNFGIPEWGSITTNDTSGDYLTNFTIDGTTITKSVASFHSLTIGRGLSGSSYNPKTPETTISLLEIAAGSASTGALAYNGTIAAAGKFSSSEPVANASNKLAYSGNFHTNYIKVDDLVLDGNTLSSFNTNGYILLQPYSNSKVGIGAIPETEKLEIAGNVKLLGDRSLKSSGSLEINGSDGVILYGGSTGVGIGRIPYGYALDIIGNVRSSGAFYSDSDRRLKENIKDYEYKNSILDIEVKEFNYIESKEHTIGIIAQDLQERFPELVKEDSNGFLAISENKLVYLLMKEVKQLKDEIQQLKEEK